MRPRQRVLESSPDPADVRHLPPARRQRSLDTNGRPRPHDGTSWDGESRGIPRDAFDDTAAPTSREEPRPTRGTVGGEGLTAFLRSRRARLSPAQVGLTPGPRRRTPGLRREEVALLAGVSVDYYTRLEQGRQARPSRAVVDALASALCLDLEEHSYLVALAGPDREGPDGHAGRHLPVLDQTVAMLPVPALLLSEGTTVLRWNPAAAEMFVDFGRFQPGERNVAWLQAHDPDMRSRYPDPAAAVAASAGHLRAAWGRRPDDADLNRLVTRLTETSAEFRQAWERHEVRAKSGGEKVMVDRGGNQVRYQYEYLVAASGTAMAVFSPLAATA